MTDLRTPVGARRRLGAELRRLRTKSGLTLDQVADQMTCSTSKISRLETGKGIPKAPDVRELMRIYKVTSDEERDLLLRLVHEGREHGWWERLTEGVHPERFFLDAPDRYTSLESAASGVSSFEPAVLHGLLQTPEYTRALMGVVLPHHEVHEIERLVELRQQRQLALVERDPPLHLHAVIDEAVLHRGVGTPAVMTAQLRAIVEHSTLPNVTVQVMPFEQGFHRAHVGSFVIIEFPPEAGSDVVFIEGHGRDTYLESASDVDVYKDVFRDVVDRAHDPQTSRALIARHAQ
jgi:transcriptional regulator with XRE-family HTH domain